MMQTHILLTAELRFKPPGDYKMKKWNGRPGQLHVVHLISIPEKHKLLCDVSDQFSTGKRPEPEQ